MFKRLLTLAGVAAALAGPAIAQGNWPDKPVTVIVPYAAGGNTDVAARIFTERLSARLGKPFLVENRSGAGGTIGITAMARSAPDGYTLATITAGNLYILPHIYRDKLGYDTFKDLKPLAMVATQPNFFVVHPSIPAGSPKEFIDHLKANPNKYSYGSSGIGTSQHLCMELLAQKTGVQVQHVPYRASNQIMQDLVGGQIQMSCDQISTALAQVKGGNAKGVAVSSTSRYAMAPEFPAMAETVPGIDVTWAAIFIAPAGLPKPIADKLIAELAAISKEPEVIEKLQKLTVTPVSVVGAELEAQIKADFETWKPIVESAKIPQPN
ncbi:MAG: tripartite tricarboxylate transporter substrate binding protein [Methylocystis sp.]|nr:tripartite tricarboxylate transporter substrate binding protein [Methylocystis sp.]MCA3584074.1 tripartite tricarboxylate transporter substrate binding protein [Methylocystis sp.]MCA3587036.1 tripartite tricarboxylate transporter substrate binding protein [Methylocystis sp.]MCA3591194.1 tripartite tricarboxylate transporter substrate binding protein [Methylocystis sp.]